MKEAHENQIAYLQGVAEGLVNELYSKQTTRREFYKDVLLTIDSAVRDVFLMGYNAAKDESNKVYANALYGGGCQHEWNIHKCKKCGTDGNYDEVCNVEWCRCKQ